MGDELIRAYLSELDAALAVVPGSPRARAAIAAEIGDGLTDAVTDHLDRGCPPAEAEQRAIDEFGGAALVAAQFVPVLAARQVHRCALLLMRTGPLVGALWLVTVLLARLPRPTIASQITVTAAIMVATTLVIAVPCTVFAATVTGRSVRWLTVPPRHAAAAALIGTGAAVIGDLVLLIALGTQVPMLLTESSRIGLGIVLAGLAALASLIRLACTTRGTMLLRRSHAVLGTA